MKPQDPRPSFSNEPCEYVTNSGSPCPRKPTTFGSRRRWICNFHLGCLKRAASHHILWRHQVRG